MDAVDSNVRSVVGDKCLVLPLRVQRVSPGPTRSTSTSGRSVSTPSPTGLATCPWSTHSFAWTPCSSKIKCLSSERSTKTWRELENDGQNVQKGLKASSFWSSGLLDRQMDQSMDSQEGKLKTVWDVDKMAVWSVCDMDKVQSSDRPWWTVLDYIHINMKRKGPI